MQYNLKENMTEEQKKILKQGLMSSEIVEDIGDRMEQEIKEVTKNRNPIAMAKTLDNFSINKEYEKHVIEVIKKLRNEQLR